MLKQNHSFQIIAQGIMIVASILTLLPLLLLLMSSFADNKSILLYGYSLIPHQFSLEAYQYIWREHMQIFRAYFITIFVTVLGTSAGLAMSILYAYALSRPDFPGKRFFSFFILFTMLFNGGLVPTYIMYTRYLHLKNTIFALIIPSLLMNAFNVILIRSYFQHNVPASLIEAARIDGAKEFRVLTQVVFPVSKPIIATIGLFIGVGYWNDWLNGLYYVTDNRLYSIQQILNNMLKNIEYLSKNATSVAKSTSLAGQLPAATVRMAIAVIALLPILIIYPIVQKYFVRGIALGAVKG
ncbi:carbohydrate ABC transporter permease [Oscillospiraceae bacterium HV4-5-C5C]|nr:carbohydrate ABC transporter permease [Oscillospiraceae bacterium HV4-5-C5C]